MPFRFVLIGLYPPLEISGGSHNTEDTERVNIENEIHEGIPSWQVRAPCWLATSLYVFYFFLFQ